MNYIYKQNYTQLFFSNYKYLLITILLSIPAILLGDYAVFIFPVLIAIILSFIFGERFIIALVLITLFTLVGELNRSLRMVVHIVDFSLLGILFLKRFGLNFQEYKRVPRSIIYFILFYFSAMLLSSAMSSYPFAGIGIIARQFAFFIIVYVFYSLIRDKKDVHNYSSAIIIVAFVLVSISIFFLFQEPFSLLDLMSKNRARVSALITNPEASTNFFIISIPFLIISLLQQKEPKKRILSIFLLLYLSFGLILVMSRSAILGIILSSSIILFLLRRRRFYQLSFTLISLGLLFLFYAPLNETLTLFLRIEEGMSARDQIWKMSIEMIKDHPTFGIGPGAYKFETFNYFPYMFDSWWGKLMIYFYDITDGINFSHNYFLVLFTELGIFGFVTAIALPIIYFRIGLKTLKKFRQESQETYFFIVALFAAGTSIIFRNFFNSIGLLYLGGISTDLPFWLIFSCLLYYYQMPPSKKVSIHL